MLRCYHQLNLAYFQNDEGSKTMFSELLSEKQHIKTTRTNTFVNGNLQVIPPSSNSAQRRIIPYQKCNSLCGHCHREASK